MNRALFFRHFLCLLMLPVLTAVAAGSLRIEILVVDHPKVHPASGTDPGKIGNVQLTLADGTTRLLTETGLASAAKVAAQGKIIGWTEGQIIPYEDRDQPWTKAGYPTVPTLFPKCIVLRREGHLRQIVPEKLYRVQWKFFKEGKQIGVKSEGSHGPTHLQLFDTATGKLLDSRLDFQKNLPAWAREL